jgi:hypothetical protein
VCKYELSFGVAFIIECVSTFSNCPNETIGIKSIRKIDFIKLLSR